MKAAFDQVRRRAERLREEGASTWAEHAGAMWAIDAVEALLLSTPAPSRFADDFHELTYGSARGG